VTKIAWHDIPRYLKEKEKLGEAVVKQTIQDTIRSMQQSKAHGGHMPVDTGFLRNSLVSSLEGVSKTGSTSYLLIAGEFSAGDFAEFLYTAVYAPHVNSGARGRAGEKFVEYAASMWGRHLRKNVKRAREGML